ncbi:CopG family transcriptional regulator, partial [Brasilonema sp. CT11]|nr:CopG family transcriptional regulator [Brasilonema sp. CT11]
DLYDQPKVRTTVALTKEAQEALDIRAKELGISRSELLERFARGIVGLPEQLTQGDKGEISKSTGHIGGAKAKCPC